MTLYMISLFPCSGYKMNKDTPPDLMYHRLIEATKFAYAKRSELADEDFVDIRNVSNHEKYTIICKFSLPF